MASADEDLKFGAADLVFTSNPLGFFFFFFFFMFFLFLPSFETGLSKILQFQIMIYIYIYMYVNLFSMSAQLCSIFLMSPV